jgi:hypothetical protein
MQAKAAVLGGIDNYGMEDPERRVRQLLARHIQFRAEDAGREPLDVGSCHQLVSLVRLWQAVGDDWDQPETLGNFDHLMSDVELGPPVMSVSDDELLAGARAVRDAARVLS